MEEGTSDTDQPDIKRLISQRKKRPAFARMISWEFSHAAEKQESGKPSSTKRKQKVVSQPDKSEPVVDKAELGTEEVAGRHERLSTIGSVESTSSDDSEYYSAAEDEDDLQVICTALDDVVTNDNAFTGAGMDQLVPDVQETSSAACLHPGRRRRLSKKQKRKKTKEYRILFADNILVFDNLLDLSGDIDEACVEVCGQQGMARIQRSVPTLVELCMAATQKVDRSDYCQLPTAMKRSVASWRVGERSLQKQLTWLQNHVLPKGSLVDDHGYLIFWRNTRKYETDLKQHHDTLVLPTRSVWEAIPWPMVAAWNEHRSVYQSGKAASFLLNIDFQLKDYVQLNVNLYYDYDEYIYNTAVTSSVYLSALASCVDLMLPAAVTYRGSGPTVTGDSDPLTHSLTIAMARVKHALKSRFPLLVDKLFDIAVPYVMWVRGNAAIATTLFRKVIQDEKRSRYKAMYLSEIGRMNAMFGDSELASTFYKLATEIALEKGKHSSADIDEATEHLQILKAHAHDVGVLSPEKAQKASQYWTGALHLPGPRLPTALAAVETFLCYHAAHSTGRRWTEEALARIRVCEEDHAYLQYAAAMILALDGRAVESRRMYGTCRARLMENVPGQSMASRPCAKGEVVKNPWHPLVAIATNQQSPIMPLDVVWRTQLTSPSLSQVRKWEADITSDHVNLRLNGDGNVTGDLQMVLPPIRDVALDPYDGSYVIGHVPSLTNQWKSSYLPKKKHIMFSEMFLPTQHLIYSDSDGTTVHLEKTSLEAAEGTRRWKDRTMPLVLYWQSGGHTARLDILSAFKTEMKRLEEEKVRNTAGFSEDMRQEMMDMIPLCYRMSRSMSVEHLQESYQKKRVHDKKAGKKEQKRKPPPKRSKYWYLPELPIYVIQTGEAVVYGKTIWIPFRCHQSQQWSLFVDVKDRKRFLNVKVRAEHRTQTNQKLPSFQLDSTDSEFLPLLNPGRTSINVISQGGDCDDILPDMLHEGAPVADCCPCIVGSCIFTIDKGRISVGKHLIGFEDLSSDEDIEDQRAIKSSWALTPYWSLVCGVEEREIKDMKVVGRHFQGRGKLLLLYSTIGLSFMDPDTLELVPFVIRTDNGMSSLPLNEDGNIVFGKFMSLEVLAEKHYMEDRKQISLVAVAIDYHILVFEIQTPSLSEDIGMELNLITSLALPGIPKEACFIGKVGFLVSVSQHTDREQFYREHVFHFNLDGHLYGVLLCLGQGPRSFLPVYLHGNSDTAEGRGRVGWYVYMQDGRGGIMGVKLHGKGL